MPPAWVIQPNVCIAKEAGDVCKMIIHVKTENLPANLYCLFLDNQKIACSKQGEFLNQIPIEITQNGLLQLKNKDNQTVLTHTLSVKYQQLSKTRRRVRNPWSIF
ncbi:DUF3019 domain-containing protein [Paraglaciecola sp.]|uniref:DUF3019 domain-containing protein n=1 Tax=Paraglaciecola sp. TaxID=1920173 RepID=UPI003EF40C98